MKILVTGANGQLGKEFKELNMPSLFEFVCLGRHELDIRNSNEVSETFEYHKPDIIINAAAYTKVDLAESEQDEAYAVNCFGVENLARSANVLGCPILHISTDYVFDGDSSAPYGELDLTRPLGAYGKTKLEGEIAIKTILDSHIILRTSWLFGRHSNNFVKTMLRLANNQKELKIIGDQWGGPTSSRGLAECCLSICKKINNTTSNFSMWGTYHYSGFPYTNWFGFAKVILTEAQRIGIIDKKPKIKMVTSKQYPVTAIRPMNSRLDCSKLYENFKIMPDDWTKQLNIVLKSLQ